MEYKQIQELIKTINKSNISELSIEERDFKITIKQESIGHVQFVPQQQQDAQTRSHQPSAQQSVPYQVPPIPAEKPTAPVDTSNLVTIKSTEVGTFYRRPSEDKPLFVNVGDEIKTGQVLCIIKALNLSYEIESEINGRIIKVIADDSTPVEYDQPLFLVEPI